MDITFHFKQNFSYLGLFFNNNIQLNNNNITSYQLTCRKRIIKQFLCYENNLLFNEPNVKEKNSIDEPYFDLELSLNNLFKELKIAHKLNEEHKKFDLIDFVQHEYLNPTLRPYQIDAVKWMIYREKHLDFLPSEFISVYPIKCNLLKFIEQNNLPKLYLNPITLELNDHDTGKILLPSGGILADEMGLGKTVEILALILLNPKEKPSQVKQKKYDDICEIVPLSKRNKFNGFLCICNKRNISNLQNDIIECKGCNTMQHKKCVLKYERNNDDILENYFCPSCWRYADQIESSATIIVSPVAIKKQWESEIKKHINNDNFKVLIYDGVKNSGWINPMVMASYDVVITDYNVLSSEIYFANSKEYSGLRFQKKFLNPISPLPFVKWYRVCLDEAQMVETTSNSSSLMVKTFPTIHRWSITGTPVAKKIDNLYGLLYFLDCRPYTDERFWSKLSIPYKNGNIKPLVDVLKKIMWRTCKNDVLEQINIPIQETFVRYLNMSDVESFFYQMQHEKYSINFNLKSLKFENDLSISKMDNHTLNLVSFIFHYYLLHN